MIGGPLKYCELTCSPDTLLLGQTQEVRCEQRVSLALLFDVGD